jgi:hypothetical protein
MDGTKRKYGRTKGLRIYRSVAGSWARLLACGLDGGAAGTGRTAGPLGAGGTVEEERPAGWARGRTAELAAAGAWFPLRFWFPGEWLDGSWLLILYHIMKIIKFEVGPWPTLPSLWIRHWIVVAVIYKDITM